MLARRRRPIETAQALDQFGVIGSSQHYFFEMVSLGRVRRKFLVVRQQHISVTKNYRQTVIEIMSDSASHRAKSSHPLLLNHLALRVLEFANGFFQINGLALQLDG